MEKLGGCEGKHEIGMDEGIKCATWKGDVRRYQCGLGGKGLGAQKARKEVYGYEKRRKSLHEIDHV